MANPFETTDKHASEMYRKAISRKEHKEPTLGELRAKHAKSTALKKKMAGKMNESEKRYKQTKDFMKGISHLTEDSLHRRISERGEHLDKMSNRPKEIRRKFGFK